MAPVRSGSLAALSGRFLVCLADEMQCSVLDNVREVTVGDYGTVFDPRRGARRTSKTPGFRTKILRESYAWNVDGRFALVNCSTVSACGSHDKLIASVFTGFLHRGVRRKKRRCSRQMCFDPMHITISEHKSKSEGLPHFARGCLRPQGFQLDGMRLCGQRE